MPAAATAWVHQGQILLQELLLLTATKQGALIIPNTALGHFSPPSTGQDHQGTAAPTEPL